MKKYLNMLAFWCFASLIFAQNQGYINLLINERYQEVIDSVNLLAESELTPDDIICKAKAHDLLGQKTLACDVLNKGLALFSSDSVIVQKLASQYYQLGDYSSALPLLTKINSLSPTQFQSAYELSRIYTFNKKYNDAINVLMPCFLHDSVNVTCMSALVENYTAIDSCVLATNYSRRILLLSPGNQKVSLQLCQLYKKQELFDSIVFLCDDVLKRDSLNALFLTQKGIAKYNLEEFDCAANVFDQLLNLGDSSLNVLRYHGFTKYMLKDYQSAINSLTIYYGQIPMDWKACQCIAKSYSYLKGGEREALRYFNFTLDALMNDEDIANIYTQMGDVAVEMKDILSAERYYSEAMKRAPTEARNLYAMATLLDFHKNNKKSALKYYERYISVILRDTSEQDSTSSFFKQRKAAFAFSNQRIQQLKEDMFFQQN